MDRQERFWVVGLMAVALMLAGALAAMQGHMNADSLYYLIPVRNLFAGDGLTYNGVPQTVFPPGYGLVTYPVYVLLRDFEVAGTAVSVLLYAGLVALMYGISRQIYRHSSAVLAAMFTLITPTLLIQAGQAMSDVTYVTLYLLAFCVMLRTVWAGNLPIPWAITLGGLFGLLYLTRPESLALVGLCGLALVWTLARQTRRVKGLVSVGAVFGVFALLMIPYVLFLHDSLGEWTISGKVRQNIIRDEYVEDDLATYDDVRVGEFIRQDGAAYLQRVLTNAKDSVIQLIGMNRGVFFLAGAVGLLYALRYRRLPSLNFDASQRQALAVQALFFLPILSYPFFYIEYRFFLAQSLILFLPLAYFVGRCGAALVPTLPPKPLFVALCLLICPLYFYSLVPFFKDASLDTAFNADWPLKQSKQAGQWLYEHAENPTQARVIGPGKINVIAYYVAGGEEHPFDWMSRSMTAAELCEDMLAGRYDYLIMEQSYRAFNPALFQLWQQPDLAPQYGLVLLHQTDKFQVYRPASEGAC